jgi:hypothetical protein
MQKRMAAVITDLSLLLQFFPRGGWHRLATAGIVPQLL